MCPFHSVCLFGQRCKVNEITNCLIFKDMMNIYRIIPKEEKNEDLSKAT